jgi:calcineurin-like phosphoesterase family protein
LKIAIISDLHFGVRSNNKFFLEKQEEFFYNCFFPYIEENNIDTVWFLGDFFENRKVVSIQILNRASAILDEFGKRGIKLYMILGNHDVYYRNTNDISSIPPVVRPFKNVHLIEDHEVINFDGIDVAFISWIPESDKQSSMEWMKNVNTKILCGHFEINNFEMITGVYCSSGWFGDNWFDGFDRVFSRTFPCSCNQWTNTIHW